MRRNFHLLDVANYKHNIFALCHFMSSYHDQVLYSISDITVNCGLNERFYTQKLYQTQPSHVLIF